MAKLEKRSYADRAEYLKKAVTERRRKLKRMLVEYKGGACVLCGYSGYFGAFDLHHTGDSPKAFGIAAGGFPDHGNRSSAKLISASCCAPTVIEKCTEE